MPIKFRCQYCRQFLGISRAKAGEQVDCPSCGRAIRVPQLDGRIEPIEKPKLNLADSSLASALDELAMLAQPIADPEATEETPEPSMIKPIPIKTVQPVPAPVPVPLAPPLPPRKVTPLPQPEVSPSALESTPSREEIARLAAESVTPGNTRGWKAVRSRSVLILLLLVCGLSFALGYWFGQNNPLNGTLLAEGEQPQTSPPAPEKNPQQVGVPLPASLALKGRITYKSVDGDSRPDEGARVIVFPQKKAGSAQLPLEGFRAHAEPVDFQLAQVCMRTLGGDLGTVNAQGEFEISLVNPGVYFVLVISSHQEQSEQLPIGSDLQQLLAEYFSRPQQFRDQLLGRVQYEFTTVRLHGQDVQTWDHSFARL